jgi:hypothetical protein
MNVPILAGMSQQLITGMGPGTVWSSTPINQAIVPQQQQISGYYIFSQEGKPVGVAPVSQGGVSGALGLPSMRQSEPVLNLQKLTLFQQIEQPPPAASQADWSQPGFMNIAGAGGLEPTFMDNPKFYAPSPTQKLFDFSQGKGILLPDIKTATPMAGATGIIPAGSMKGVRVNPLETFAGVTGAVESIWNPKVPSMGGAAVETLVGGGYNRQFLGEHPFYYQGSGIGEALQWLPISKAIRAGGLGTRISVGVEDMLGLSKKARAAAMFEDIKDPLSRALVRKEVDEGFTMARRLPTAEKGMKLDRIIYGPLGEADYPGGQYLKLGYEQVEAAKAAPKGFEGGRAYRRWASGGLNYEQAMKIMGEPLPKPATSPANILKYEKSLARTSATFSSNIPRASRIAGFGESLAIGKGVSDLAKGRSSMSSYYVGLEPAFKQYLDSLQYQREKTGDESVALPPIKSALGMGEAYRMGVAQEYKTSSATALDTIQSLRLYPPSARQVQDLRLMPPQMKYPRWLPKPPLRRRDDDIFRGLGKRSGGSYEERINPFNQNFIRDLRRMKV